MTSATTDAIEPAPMLLAARDGRLDLGGSTGLISAAKPWEMRALPSTTRG